MKKKVLTITLAIVMTLLLFAGCGTKKVSTTSEDANKTTIIRLGCWASSPAETKLLDDQIQVFQVQYPNIVIKKEVVTGDYLQTMQAKIASKTAPDVYYLDVSLASTFMSKGLLAPLDEYLDQNDVKDFETNLLKGYQKDGKTYGLPKDYNTLCIFYNKDMLKAANVNPPTTWQEMTDAAAKLTKGNVLAFSLANDPARFIPFMFEAGAKIVDGDKVAFNTPEGAKGLDFYYSFFKNGTAKTPKDLGEGWNGDALAHKKVAMVIEGGWMIPYMPDAAKDVNYGIAKLPKGDNEGDLAFTVGYVMNKDSQNKKEATDVIKFLTGTKAQELTAESGLAIPTRKSMNQVYAQKHPEAKALVDMTSVSQVYDFGVNGSKILDALSKASEKLQLGSLPDGAAALKDAESNIQQ